MRKVIRFMVGAVAALAIVPAWAGDSSGPCDPVDPTTDSQQIVNCATLVVQSGGGTDLSVMGSEYAGKEEGAGGGSGEPGGGQPSEEELLQTIWNTP